MNKICNKHKEEKYANSLTRVFMCASVCVFVRVCAASVSSVCLCVLKSLSACKRDNSRATPTVRRPFYIAARRWAWGRARARSCLRRRRERATRRRAERRHAALFALARAAQSTVPVCVLWWVSCHAHRLSNFVNYAAHTHTHVHSTTTTIRTIALWAEPNNIRMPRGALCVCVCERDGRGIASLSPAVPQFLSLGLSASLSLTHTRILHIVTHRPRSCDAAMPLCLLPLSFGNPLLPLHLRLCCCFSSTVFWREISRLEF